MAVAVAVAVSGGVAVPVAVPVAGLTKRFFHQKDFLINGWGYPVKEAECTANVKVFLHIQNSEKAKVGS